MSAKRMLGAVALLAIVLRPGAAARTGVCTDVSASVPSGSCANTTLPFRACVLDDTSLAKFTQKLVTDLQTSVTYGLFDTATCPTMTNFTKIGCEKQGGNIRTGICDAGGPYCSNILVSVIDQYACRREDDATCTLPELGSSAPARLSCCESLKTVTLSQCDLTGVAVDWETQVRSAAPACSRMRASPTPMLSHTLCHTNRHDACRRRLPRPRTSVQTPTVSTIPRRPRMPPPLQS